MVLLPGTGQLIGMLAATGALGVYLVMFFISIHFLREHRTSLARSERTHNSILFAAAIIFFVLIVTDWCLGVDLLRRTFMTAHPNPAKPNNTHSVARTTLVVVKTILLDLVLLYRVYSIWAKNLYVVVLPGLSLLASSITGIYMFSRFAENVPIPTGLVDYKLWLSFSLATNLLAVGLIAYRIRSLESQLGAAAVDETKLSFVLVVVMESAAVYCVCNAAALISGAVGSMTMVYFFLNIMGVVTGIAFSLILVRVRQERHSRYFRRTLQAVGVSLPRRSHAVDSLPHKQSDIA